MITTYKATADIDVVTSSFRIPGMGLVPINAFVLHGSQPVLVDTGSGVESDEFMTALRSVIDPDDIRWIGSPTRTSTTSARCIDCSTRTRGCASSQRS